MKNTFGKWLQENRKDAQLSMQDLADKVGLSKQYISILERGEPHTLTGKPVTPQKKFVDALAKALNRPINEARYAAGYAGEKRLIPPEIEAIGFEGLEKSDLETIVAHIEFIKSQREKRNKKKPKTSESVGKSRTRKIVQFYSEKEDNKLPSTFEFADEDELIAAGGNPPKEED